MAAGAGRGRHAAASAAGVAGPALPALFHAAARSHPPFPPARRWGACLASLVCLASLLPAGLLPQRLFPSLPRARRTHRQDAVGNLVIRRPGSGGGEAAPPVIVQGHVDMVTEMNAGVQHDFMSDPIRLVSPGRGRGRLAAVEARRPAPRLCVLAADNVLTLLRSSARAIGSPPMAPRWAVITVREGRGEGRGGPGLRHARRTACLPPGLLAACPAP